MKLLLFMAQYVTFCCSPTSLGAGLPHPNLEGLVRIGKQVDLNCQWLSVENGRIGMVFWMDMFLSRRLLSGIHGSLHLKVHLMII